MDKLDALYVSVPIKWVDAKIVDSLFATQEDTFREYRQNSKYLFLSYDIDSSTYFVSYIVNQLDGNSPSIRKNCASETFVSDISIVLS